MIFVYAFALYALVGLVVAIAFVAVGVTRVLAQPTPASTGARLIWLPGAAALWPYVLVRWAMSGRKQ